MGVFRSERELDSYIHGLSAYTTALVTILSGSIESIIGDKLCTETHANITYFTFHE